MSRHDRHQMGAVQDVQQLRAWMRQHAMGGLHPLDDGSSMETVELVLSIREPEFWRFAVWFAQLSHGAESVTQQGNGSGQRVGLLSGIVCRVAGVIHVLRTVRKAARVLQAEGYDLVLRAQCPQSGNLVRVEEIVTDVEKVLTGEQGRQ